jgi:hypothetical protein
MHQLHHKPLQVCLQIQLQQHLQRQILLSNSTKIFLKTLATCGGFFIGVRLSHLWPKNGNKGFLKMKICRFLPIFQKK